MDLLLKEGPLTRLDLQRKLGVSRPTLSAAVKRLIGSGALVEQGQAEYGAGRNGRPQALLGPNGAAGNAIGIELARTNVVVSVVTMTGDARVEESVKAATEMPLQGKLEAALDLIRALAARASVDLTNVVGIGLGVTGRYPIIDPETGVSTDQPVDLDLTPLSSWLGAPITWDNNTRMSAIHYASQAALPASDDADVLFVVLSSGVSGAVLSRGDIFRGAGAAGELGHVCVQLGGAHCSCGLQGCLEAYVGIDAVLQNGRSRGLRLSQFKDLENHGDEFAHGITTKLAQEVGTYLGAGLSSAAMMLDPDRIVLSGPLLAMGTPLVSAAYAELSARRSAVHLSVPNVEVAAAPVYRSSRGAALRVLQIWGTSFLLQRVHIAGP